MKTVARELHTLGNALELAARRDLARASRSAARRRKLVAVAVGLAIAVPGLAYAATALIGAKEVAASLPGGLACCKGPSRGARSCIRTSSITVSCRGSPRSQRLQT